MLRKCSLSPASALASVVGVVAPSSGSFARLLGLFRIDDGNQKVLELGKQLLERLGSLPPRQAGCEHFVGFGRDAEMTRGVPPGEYNEEYAREDHEESITP